jgi:type I restriction enzyme, R subunit
VAADSAYLNGRQNTPQTARIEHDKALAKAMLTILKDETELYKQFVQNPSFKQQVTDMVFALTSATLAGIQSAPESR